MTLQYVDRVPTPEEHRRLAESVGWTHAIDWDGVFQFSVQHVVVLRHGFAAHPGMTGMFRVAPDGSSQP